MCFGRLLPSSPDLKTDIPFLPYILGSIELQKTQRSNIHLLFLRYLTAELGRGLCRLLTRYLSTQARSPDLNKATQHNPNASGLHCIAWGRCLLAGLDLRTGGLSKGLLETPPVQTEKLLHILQGVTPCYSITLPTWSTLSLFHPRRTQVWSRSQRHGAISLTQSRGGPTVQQTSNKQNIYVNK